MSEINGRYRIMNRNCIRKAYLTVVTCAAVILAFPQQGFAAETGTMKAGAAKIDITPETPIPMSGYGGRKEPFKGIHDNIYARAVVFDDGDIKAVVISADVIGFSHDFRKKLTDRLARETGIAPDNVFLTTVHNHGGPVTMVYNRGPVPEVVAYAAYLEDHIVRAVRSANDALQPVTIGSGKGKCLMNINRRSRDPQRGVSLGRNPYGPCDHEVGVVSLNGLDGKPLALLVNWACHGTVTGPRNLLITGDWPGAASRFIEEKSGDGVVALMLIGASGDINPIYGPHIDFEDVSSYSYAVDEIGMVLGEEVMDITEEITTYKGGMISTEQRIIKLPGKQEKSNLQQPKLESGNTVSVRLSALKIGRVVFTGVSGEVFTEIGMQLKEYSPYKNTFMVTHCNGSSGYFITDKAYDEGGYEARSTRVKSGAEHAIIKNLLEMIHDL